MHVPVAGASATARLAPAASASVAPASWRRQRFWFTVPQHQMLQRCAVSAAAGTAATQCQLSKSHLAYLCDHQVGRERPFLNCVITAPNLQQYWPWLHGY